VSRALRLLPLLLAAALALPALPMPGTSDVGTSLGWADAVAAHGIVDGYRLAASLAPYPPLGYVVLGAVHPLASSLGTTPLMAFKLSVLGALLLSTAIAWAWTRDAAVAGLLALGLVLSGPALGYIDLYFLPALLLSLWALQRGRLGLASALFAASCLIKWQPAVLAPPLLVFVLAPAAPAGRLRRLARVALPALAVTGLTIAVFGTVVVERLIASTNNPFLCGQALNANWIVSYAVRLLVPARFADVPEGLCPVIVTGDPAALLPPKLLFAAAYLAILVATGRRARSFAGFLQYALLAYLAYFLFNAGVHENHLFIGQVLAVLLYAFDRRRIGTALYWSAASNLNLLIYYGVRGEELGAARLAGGLDLGLPLALLNLAAFVVLAVGARRNALNQRAAPRTQGSR